MPVYFTPALTFRFVCVTFVLSITTTWVTMNGNFVTPLFYVHNMFTKNMAIEKHTIHSVSVSDPWECFRHCAKDCDCVTFQVTERICELLDTDQHGAAGDLMNRPGTLLFSMQQSVLQGAHGCFNGCCKSKPCLHGGTCVEKCDDVRERYTCACPKHHQGRRCEIFQPQVSSCQAHMELKPGAQSGVHELNDTIQTYCDFNSEAGKAWTLIESFSLENKALYQNQPFYYDYPQNERNVNWNSFRLSYQALVNIRNNSTHWRVTCDFPSGLDLTDYARSALMDTDILTFVNQDKCRRYEFISVRGISCSNCTGMLVQRDNQHMHTDSYWSGRNGCQWNPVAGAVNNEDNFGFYNVINPQHKCTNNSHSTTQWWLGSEI